MRPILSYTLALLLTLLSGVAAAQGPTARLKSSPMLAGTETLTFDLSYSVAFIKGSVGTATLTTTQTRGGGCSTRLLLRTKNAVETFFPMRDTMQTWYGADRLPQRFYKGIDENKYRMRDEVTYRFTPKTVFTSARQYHEDGTLRESRDSRIDATSAAVLDLISMVAYVRAIPEDELAAAKSGQSFIIPLGKELTEGRFTFIGYKVRKYQGKSVSTMEVSFDIGDPGFKKNRDTLRLYITRDAKRLPIFARAELAIGSVDCRLVSDK